MRTLIIASSLALFVTSFCPLANADTAHDWYQGNPELQQKLAKTVEKLVQSNLRKEVFMTGSDHFNGEWLFGTYMMAAMGFGQIAQEHPELKPKYLPLMSLCIEKMLSDKGKEFDRISWQEDPIDKLDNSTDHAAYLGYLNLVLSYHRLLDPDSKFSDLNDRITKKLAKNLEKSPSLLLLTFPGAVFPVDNCAVISSIALYDRATKSDHHVLMKRWISTCKQRYVDASTGLLFQSVHWKTSLPIDYPRGSGTNLAAYFLSFGDKAFSNELYRASQKQLLASVYGFAVVREYPESVKDGKGDIDSGPIIMGAGVSSTGFFVGAARIHQDGETYKALYKTVETAGVPTQSPDRLEFTTGGPIGNAILFAMLTAHAQTE